MNQLVADKNGCRIIELTPKEEAETIANRAEHYNYAAEVERLIRERYSVSDELAILRQRTLKSTEYNEYYAFCEECKLKAKENANL